MFHIIYDSEYSRLKKQKMLRPILLRLDDLKDRDQPRLGKSCGDRDYMESLANPW